MIGLCLITIRRYLQSKKQVATNGQNSTVAFLQIAAEVCDLIENDDDEFANRALRLICKQLGITSAALYQHQKKEIIPIATYGETKTVQSTGNLFRRKIDHNLFLLIASADDNIENTMQLHEAARALGRVWKLKREYADHKKNALTNEVTGAPNGNAWYPATMELIAILQRMFYKDVRDDKQTLTLRPNRLTILYVDIDFFKSFNDVHGHDVGDLVLCAVADILQKLCNRGTQFFGHLHGDEFVVSFLVQSTEEALHFAEKIQMAIRQLDLKLPKEPRYLDVSIGISVTGPKDLFIEQEGVKKIPPQISKLLHASPKVMAILLSAERSANSALHKAKILKGTIVVAD